MSQAPKIAIAPEGHAWAESVAQAVKEGGGEIVAPAEARALMWLGKEGDDLRDFIHDGTEWVQLRAAGVEFWCATGEIDEKRTFTSARGAYAKSVGEHTIALLLAAAKSLHTSARSDHWDREREGGSFRGSTVGIIGAGGIGQQVIDYLQPFDVDIVAVTRSGTDVAGASRSIAASQLESIWPILDFVVILAPATEETKALVGASQLAAMKETAWVINVARGSLVDTQALIDALRSNSIAGAMLDVTDPEPLPDGHPLWTMDNVLITPHVANPKKEQHLLLADHVKANVLRFAKGEDLLAVVDVKAGY